MSALDTGCGGQRWVPECYAQDCSLPGDDDARVPEIFCDALATAAVAASYADRPISSTDEWSKWEAEGLPAGLDIDPRDGTIRGTPERPGHYELQISAQAESAKVRSSTDCTLRVQDRLAVDTEQLPGHCVSAMDLANATMSSFLRPGTGDNSAIGCTDLAVIGPNDCPLGDGNGVRPPGVEVQWDCTLHGTPELDTRIGTHVWMVKVTQSGNEVFVPFCATRPAAADQKHQLSIRADDQDLDPYLPYLLDIDFEDALKFGTGAQDQTAPDPEFQFEDPDCASGECDAREVFLAASCSAFAPDEWSLDPFTALKDAGSRITGGSHGLQGKGNQTAAPIDKFTGRPWVSSLHLSYCTGAAQDDCTTPEDAQTLFTWSLIAYPHD